MAKPTLAELRSRLQRSEAHNAALQAELERFARSLSHDLRAPVRHITAYAPLLREMLAEGDDPSRCLDTLEQAAQHMGRMLEALMALSKLSRTTLQPAPVPMASLVAEARRAVAAESQGRQIHWQLPAEWPEIHGDAALLRQVWQHLLSNAIKFTRRQAQARIALGWQRQADGSMAFFVQDNGVGFQPTQSATMFDLFQRLHPASEFEGDGVGLALARQIVLRHGGGIGAQGMQNQGCTVTFTLPFLGETAAP